MNVGGFMKDEDISQQFERLLEHYATSRRVAGSIPD
jgi:hypothetical protein